MKKVLTILAFMAFVFSASAEKADSVGTKVKNGKVYIMHKVEKGQGLYSISKRYGVSLSELVAENPGSESVIKVDQIIWVPTAQDVKLEEPVVEDFFDRTEVMEEAPEEINADTPKSTWGTYHTVEKGETLWAIARQYNTSVEVIKSLNKLKTDVLSENQRLMVPSNEQGVELAEEPVEEYELDVEEAVEEMDLPEIPEVVEGEQDVEIEGYSVKVIKLEEYNLEKVEETGFAALAGDDIPANKNFAYHFNAPIGTVVMVTNPQTNKTVFVKVIANFERDDNSSTIIKLSKISAESIGLEASGQSVSLSYAR